MFALAVKAHIQNVHNVITVTGYKVYVLASCIELSRDVKEFFGIVKAFYKIIARSVGYESDLGILRPCRSRDDLVVGSVSSAGLDSHPLGRLGAELFDEIGGIAYRFCQVDLKLRLLFSADLFDLFNQRRYVFSCSCRGVYYEIVLHLVFPSFLFFFPMLRTDAVGH